LGIERRRRKRNLNLNNSGRRSVLSSFGIVIEYLRRRNHLWSGSHPFTTPKTLKPRHHHYSIIIFSPSHK